MSTVDNAADNRAWTVKVSPSIVALVLGLVLNAIAVSYSAGVITQRIDSLEQRVMRVERLLDELISTKNR